MINILIVYYALVTGKLYQSSVSYEWRVGIDKTTKNFAVKPNLIHSILICRGWYNSRDVFINNS